MQLLLESSRRFFYRHPGQLLLALIGIAAGVAVVTGVALMRDVLIDALDSATESLSGSEMLRITAPSGPLDEDLFRTLATLPGAPALLPVLSSRVRYGNRMLELLAVDPLSLERSSPVRPTGSATGQLLTQANAAVVTERTLERLNVDPNGVLQVRHSGETLNLDIVASISGGRELDDRIIMDLAAAQHLTGRQGELSFIEAAAGSRAWLEEHLPDGLELVDAEQRRDSAAALTAGMRANLTAMSLLSLAVGLFVIYSVLAFLLVQRRRTIGMLRAVGVTQGHIQGLLALETMILAGLGALAGLVLGTLMATALLELVRQPVAELYRMVASAGIRPTVGLYAAVWIMAVIMALASVLGVLREAQRIPPGQLARTVHEGNSSGSRLWRWLPVLLLALGALLIVGTRGLAPVMAGLFVMLSGCALLAPATGMQLLRLISARGDGLVPRAIKMLMSSRQRLAPAVSALSLALALSAGVGMMVLGFRATVDDWVSRLISADVYLTVSQGQLGSADVETLRNWPELEMLTSSRQVRLDDGSMVVGYDLNPKAWAAFEWVSGSKEAARPAVESGAAVLLTEPMARRTGLKPGDRIDLATPSGPASFEVAAVYRDYSNDRGLVGLIGWRFRELWQDEQRDSIGLYLRPGTEIEAFETKILDAFPAGNLTTREQVREQTLAVFDRTFRISWALAILVGMIAAIALISALLALGLERGREYATLRALGLPRRGLAGVVLTQTTSLAAIAAIMAVPFSMLIHAVLSLAVQPRAFGWSVALTWPWQPLAVIVPLALILGALAGAYPAWKIASRDPAPLLRAS
ncbi:MAG: FtsX-like permease family protein [Wenzhouxiangella sp.]|jgi:putative ABC transport system permease protein|nr:FtsX-like permease family protein [Wenzhouxiangella sp.]